MAQQPEDPSLELPQAILGGMLYYACLVNGFIAVLFNLRLGMRVLGKSPATGWVPLWSYLLLLSFHVPTYLYTFLHHWKDKVTKVPAANEVEPGWWVGGRYAASELGKKWAGIIDMTCEFPGHADKAEQYLLLACWDGVPPPPESLERAAVFAASARGTGGDILVHCAHGRGRSTTVMCACLVKSGLHPNWESALEAIKKQRRVAKLNRAMRSALSAWQSQYMDPELAPTKEMLENEGSHWMTAYGPLQCIRSTLHRARLYWRFKLK